MDDNEQKPGLRQRFKQFVEADRKKWGGMTLGASARLGLAELREAFSLGGNITQPTPYGMYGTLTPGEVGAARKDDPKVLQMEEESLQADASQAKADYEIDHRKQGTVHGESQPSPLRQMLKDDAPVPGQERGGVHGVDAQQTDRSNGSSLGHLLRDGAPRPEPDRGNAQAIEQQHERGREMGRGR